MRLSKGSIHHKRWNYKMKKKKRFYPWIINILCLLSLIIYPSCGGSGPELPGGDGGDGLFIPNAPSSLNCTAVSSSQIDLQWIDNSDNELGFNIERRMEGEAFSLVYTTKGLVHTTEPNINGVISSLTNP